MTHGWDDGDEPWNDRYYFDTRLPERQRYSYWNAAVVAYASRKKKASKTKNSELFPKRAEELRNMGEHIERAVAGYLPT